MSTLTASHPEPTSRTVKTPVSSALRVVVSATFTAEPIEASLRLWLDELGHAGQVDFAPYNQVLQQLLDPTSEFGRNDSGVNLLLVRPEDWVRFKAGGWDEATLKASTEELGDALASFAERSSIPTIIMMPPCSPGVSSDAVKAELLGHLEAQIKQAIEPYSSLHWLGADSLELYPVAETYDEAGDHVGHMPYTSLAVSAIATAVARRIHAIKSPPYKVLALDCDNTLWSGVVGEDGPHGIKLGPGMKAFQEFIVAQQEAGMVVCLVSKNAEADVLEAFDLRDDFPLRREHLVSWRIGWEAKSRGLAELAAELNLGLDSFIFMDDNPVECAEVKAALPQVLTIQVPPDQGIADLLRHTWAFDRLKVTEEDRRRTSMYRVNADRTRLESQASDISAFLASLELKIAIAEPSEDQWPRVSQLTERTNQFNFSTRRRSETEVRQLRRSGLECVCVDVSDRFGDYGLVGVAIFGAEGNALSVDTMLLSCRVLGRGVEHALFAHLGRVALDRGLAFVEARFIPSAKNEPAARFLDSLAGAVASPAVDGRGTLYRMPASGAASLVYRPGHDARDQLELARTGGKKASAVSTPGVGRDKSASYARIARELSSPEAVLRAVEAASMTGRALETPFTLPDSAVERQLVGLWRRVLNVDRVGTRDAFNDLGGTSIKAARLFVEIEKDFGIRLPMTTLLDAPSIVDLAERIISLGRGGTRKSLRLLKPGTEGGPTLFLVHDGDGEILLYLNLARRLPDEVAVYGVEPHGTDRCPTFLTTIPEMARFYVEKVREVCPAGPYLLGGLCAGGTIAFEMAILLKAAGQPVGLVALLDASEPHAELRPNFGLTKRWTHFIHTLESRTASLPDGVADSGITTSRPGVAPAATAHASRPGRALREIGRALRKVRTIGMKIRNVTRYEVSNLLKKAADASSIARLETIAAAGSEPGCDFVGPSFRIVFNHALRVFETTGQLDAPVLLVRAGGDGLGYYGDDPIKLIYREPLLGWASRVAGGPEAIEVIDVPGGHGGMLQEPNVAEIAGPLRRAIERASVAEVRR